MTLRPHLVALALIACKGPTRAPFTWPKSEEDVRAKLLVYVPEGRDIEGAREWMRAHGFTCDAPLASATEAHAHICRAAPGAPADAGWRSWTIVLYERGGRLADVSSR